MIRRILCTVYFPSNKFKAYVTINTIAFIWLSQAFMDILTQEAVINQSKKNGAIMSVLLIRAKWKCPVCLSILSTWLQLWVKIVYWGRKIGVPTLLMGLKQCCCYYIKMWPLNTSKRDKSSWRVVFLKGAQLCREQERGWPPGASPWC